MPLIRAKEAESKVQQAEVLRFQDLEAEAAGIVEAARRQADALLAEARAQAEKLKTQAHKAGFDGGRAAGIQAGMEAGRRQAAEQARAEFTRQQAPLVQALEAAMGQVEARRRDLLAQLERDAVALAGAIARRVTKVAVDVEPACLARNMREALQMVADKSRLEIRVNAADLGQAERLALTLLSSQDCQAVRFVADPAVARGGAVLRTTGGQIDAAIDTQWARIMDEILAGWQEHWLLKKELGATAAPEDTQAGEPQA